jgi:hypothetical protein
MVTQQQLLDLLRGGDLRSIGQANQVVSLINCQAEFDVLFRLLSYTDRKVVMRAADAVEKISLTHKDWLQRHKKKVIALGQSVSDKELKWHLAQLLPRLQLNHAEIEICRQLLTDWALNKKESRIVRVFAVQALYDLAQQDKSLAIDLQQIMTVIQQEDIPSLNARIRKLQSITRPCS